MMRHAYKRAMYVYFAEAKEPREESKGVTSERLIDERFLPLQRFPRATTRSVVFECNIRDLGKEFAGCAKSLRTPRIALVPWLAENKLAAVHAVAQV